MKIGETTQFFNDAFQELKRATAKNGPFASGHEAYAVILEELCEFWDEIRLKNEDRNRYNMRIELVQIAAMACRASMDLGLEEIDPYCGPSRPGCKCNCPNDCEHKWDGPTVERDQGRTQSASCSRCGMAAAEHDLWVAP